MSSRSMENCILVTGADQHQGLAVIRALGTAGYPVIACGAERHSLGSYSRYSLACHTYTSPFRDHGRFLDDILEIICRTRPMLVIPCVESTLIGLDRCRDQFEPSPVLAAPPSEILPYALDKARTLELAAGLDVPIPHTVRGSTLQDVLERASTMTFPVAIKPQGHQLYGPTAHQINFKVRYARTMDELRTVLMPVSSQVHRLLVQECIAGRGICVAALADRGVPVRMFAYARLREHPLAGGVSVVRQSVPLQDPLRRYVVKLLAAIRWHGVAMVEFKCDQQGGGYRLMEINGRFQSSTALSVDAGINLPAALVRLYLNQRVQPSYGYPIGVRERWLRGDLQALYCHLMESNPKSTEVNPLQVLPSKARAVFDFLRDFGVRTRYDEFKLSDWKPGFVEGRRLVLLMAVYLLRSVRWATRHTARGSALRMAGWWARIAHPTVSAPS